MPWNRTLDACLTDPSSSWAHLRPPVRAVSNASDRIVQSLAGWRPRALWLTSRSYSRVTPNSPEFGSIEAAIRTV